MTQHYLVEYQQTGSNELREAKRAEHIAYRKGLGADLILAGPLLTDEGKAVGSVVIIAAEGAIQAGKIATSDPFVVAGLLKLSSIKRMRIAAIAPPR